MFKPLLALLAFLPFLQWNVQGYSTNITVEDGILTSVNDKSSPEVRIYAEKGVSSIASGAFDDCTFTTLMISKTVQSNNAVFPNTLNEIFFTGSEDELNFEIPNNVILYEYGCDEGFFNFWDEFVRPHFDDSICDVTKSNYIKMKQLYNNLSDIDLQVVNSRVDGSGTIKDSVEYLDTYFTPSQSSQVIEKEIPQTTMITIILIIASFGMTSIGVFYVLKDRDIIE